MDLDNLMINIENNTGFLAESCLRNNITIDELIDIVDMYKYVIKYLSEQNNSSALRGLHDDILKELGVDE